MNREDAYALLCRYTPSDALQKHALTVEAVMRHFAHRQGEDEDYWGIVGLLHDVDYEMFPDQHCAKAPELLREAGYGEDVIHAVCSHGWQLCSDVEPTLYMEKVLYALDELTGLIAATAVMRPSKSVHDLETSSVKKKFKDKRFAAGVNRDVVVRGCEMLGICLDEAIGETILAMRAVAPAIGLEGQV